LSLVRFVFALITATMAVASARAAETGSSNYFFFLHQLDERSSFVGRANLVTRDGLSDFFFGYVDGNYRYALSGPWSVEVGYRQAFLKLDDGWREEYRPMFALYWMGELGQGYFSNRSRIELRYFEGDAKDRVRFRNESVWRPLTTITDFKLTPFVEEEFFYDLTDRVLNENWLTFGISKFWTKGVKWKLGYRLQSQKIDDEWRHRHVLVTGLSFFSTKSTANQ
jgi:hypothetical protein